jgi:hypothetical protein
MMPDIAMKEKNFPVCVIARTWMFRNPLAELEWPISYFCFQRLHVESQLLEKDLFIVEIVNLHQQAAPEWILSIFFEFNKNSRLCPGLAFTGEAGVNQVNNVRTLVRAFREFPDEVLGIFRISSFWFRN